MRKQSAQIDRRHVPQLVIEIAVEAVATAVIKIEAEIFGTGSQESSAWNRIYGLSGLEIIDPSTVVVITAAEQSAKLLVFSEALACGSVELIKSASSRDRCVAAHPENRHIRFVRRTLRHQVDRPANRIGILVGGESLVDFDHVDKIGRNGVELNVAHAFRRRHVDAIDGHVAQPRFSAANLDVLPLALVALQRDAGQPSKRVGDIRVRQAGNDFVREHLNDVVGGPFDVDGFDLAALALATNCNHFALLSDL